MTKTLYELVDMRREGYSYKNVIGGYLHLHFAQSQENIQAFIDCLEQSEIKTGRI
jgi:cobyrinic acid a,c-diamide synthase